MKIENENIKHTWKQIIGSKSQGVYFISEFERDLDIFKKHILGINQNIAIKTIKGLECTTKQELFKAFAESLEFPDYFGHNWDAFDECITDLSWLSTKKCIIFISDFDHILSQSPKDRNIFLEILQASASEAKTSVDFVIVYKPYTSSEQQEKILQDKNIQYSFIYHMRFFITGEIDKTVSEKIRLPMLDIQKSISEFLVDKNYGEGIIDWGYIIICMNQDFYDAGFFKERKHYFKKDKNLDMRLRVDYDEMLTANKKQTYQLICNSILRSVDLAKNDLKIGRNPIAIKDFDFVKFKEDLTTLFKKNGWI